MIYGGWYNDNNSITCRFCLPNYEVYATISITTIGYGDIYPTTDVGRLITMVSALVGVAVIALPSGMITAAYISEINRKKSKYEL